MIPDTDDRLASVVRALTDVVLPSLPAEAGLAREQVQLAVGQLEILRAQLDSILGHEAAELADAVALGRGLVAATGDEALRRSLEAAADAHDPATVRAARHTLHAAIDKTVANATPSQRPALHAAILAAETRRARLDRRWFAPFGFDAAPPPAA